jgi:hypothetical protein
MSWYYHGTAFPCARKLKCTLTYTPHTYGLLRCEPWAPLTTKSSSMSRVVSPARPSLYQEPLRPFGVLPRGGLCAHNLDRRYPILITTTSSCARPQPSHGLRTMAWSASLCRLPHAPAGKRPFPKLSPQSVWRCLDPYPAALLRCTCPFLPAELRPHLTCNRFGALKLPPF